MIDVRNPQGVGNITLFLPSLHGGGAERVMVTLANGFSRRGYSVDLVLAKAEGPYLVDVSEAVRVIDLNATRVATSLFKLARYLRREKPIALLSALDHANVVAILAKILARVSVRVVVSERNNFSVSNANARSLRSRAMVYFMRWAYPRADGIVAISGGVADDLAARFGLLRSEIHVVYNPAVVPDLIKRSRESSNHPWFRAYKTPVILGVGRLVAQKDFPTLIRAFNLVRKQYDVRLLILGEGPLRGELEAIVLKLGLQRLVDLPGFVNNPYSYMRTAAMFVFSSRWEGFGNVLVEAMACGTPVVSTDCPSGPAEILEHGKWGRLVPVGDIEALAEAIVATLNDEEHPNVTERAADFNVDQAVDGYLSVLLSGGPE